jgi:hypothetical protein
MLLSLSFAPPTAMTTELTKPYIMRQYQIVTGMFEEIAKVHHNLRGKERECACHFVAVINATIGFWHQGYATLDEDRASKLLHQFMHGILS